MKFSIATFVEDSEPVTGDKADVEWQDKSKVSAFFWNFRTNKILIRGKNH